MKNMTVEDIVNILSRNTIDGEAVDKTLISASVKNFKTLYDIQLDLVGLKRFDVPIRDLVRVMKVSATETRAHYPHRYSYSIPYSIISVNNRKACKEAGFYGKAVSQETISDTPSVFNFNFLILIDGKFIDTGEIVIRDAETVFILDVSAGEDTTMTDGIPMEDYLKYYEKNEIVTFMVVPNYAFSRAEFNLVTFNDVMKRKIHYNRIKYGPTTFNQDTTMFFMNTDTDKSTKRGILCTVDDENQCIVVPDSINVTSTRLCFSAITLQNIYEIKIIHGGDSCWFQLSDNYKLPVPVENIIPFVKDDSVGLVFDQKISLKLYYPNIYKIENWDGQTDLALYIMYNATNDAEYHNDLAVLNILSGNLVDRYENGSLPDMVMDYEPQDISWLTDSDSFVKSVYFPKKSLYNINALSQIVLRNPHFLIEYAYLKLKSSPKYYINVEKLSLDDRVRTDTYRECQETGEIVFFDEPMYLFSLRKKFVGSFGTDFRIFIDNLFICPLDYTLILTMDFYHFYIPCRLIKSNSIIELEKYTEYDFRREVTFEETNEPITIEIPKRIKKIYTQDITVIDLDRGVYLGEAEYKISAYSDIMESEIDLAPRGYATITNSFKVELLADRYVGRKLLINVYHRLATRNMDITDSSIPIQLSIVNSNYITADKLRVYTGGLLLPTTAYSVYDNGYYLRNAKFILLMDTSANPDKYRTLTVDEIPTGQVCEFKQLKIENEYGFVDTGNALSLPLDLKWYDIYVNGLKLNKSNVDIITSNKFFIKGIDSLKNLYIYARGDIYNEFDILHEETVENKLFHEIDEIYEDLLTDRDVIQDTMNDITGDLLKNIISHLDFVSQILEYSFLNANEQQVTEEIRMLYPELIDEHGILWLDSNTYTDASWVTMIDSNVRSDYMKNDQYRYGWTPLHIGAHDDAKAGEYMCDPITGAPGMKNEDGSVIPTGELDRLNVHKTNLQTSLGNNGLLGLDIYHVQFEENTTAKNVISGANILDDEITINEVITKAVLSLDLQILKRGYKDVLTTSSYIPNVEIQYTVVDHERQTITIPYNDLRETVLDVTGNGITIHSITVKPETETGDMTQVKCILHSILLAI